MGEIDYLVYKDKDVNRWMKIYASNGYSDNGDRVHYLSVDLLDAHDFTQGDPDRKESPPHALEGDPSVKCRLCPRDCLAVFDRIALDSKMNVGRTCVKCSCGRMFSTVPESELGVPAE